MSFSKLYQGVTVLRSPQKPFKIGKGLDTLWFEDRPVSRPFRFKTIQFDLRLTWVISPPIIRPWKAGWSWWSWSVPRIQNAVFGGRTKLVSENPDRLIRYPLIPDLYHFSPFRFLFVIFYNFHLSMLYLIASMYTFTWFKLPVHFRFDSRFKHFRLRHFRFKSILDGLTKGNIGHGIAIIFIQMI